MKEILHYLQITLTAPTEEGIHALIAHFGLEAPQGSLLQWILPWPAKLLEQGRALAVNTLNVGLDDLLWLPHVMNLRPIQKDFVLVDEAQDLSRAQLELVLKLPKETGRMIFVGDEHQAIFGFAGSDADSWNRIREAIKPREFPLSITYRCPRSHVRLASRIVPQLEPRSDAPEGEVQVIHPGEIKHLVQVGDLVLCRFTAPLIRLCLKLVIQQGIPAKVRGREVGKMLTSLVQEVVEQFPVNFLSQLRAYVEAKVKQYGQDGKTSAIELLQDRAAALEACFEAFGSKCHSLLKFCQRIEDLFDDEASATQHIILATIHRSKGDEAKRVFLLKSESMPAVFLAETEWQKRQEIHLLYVGLTRAKQSLFLVPLPPKAEQLPDLLMDPVGGIQFPETPLNQDPERSHSLGKEEQKTEALYQVLQQLLQEVVETARSYERQFPEQMIRVWPRLRHEFALQMQIPLNLPNPPPLPRILDPVTPTPPALKVGDVCRYRGPKGAMNVTCAGRNLQVLEVNQGIATVKADKWFHSYDIEIRYLRKLQ